MCIITLFGDFNNPELKCDSCDMIFILYFHKNLIYQKIEYCPFCGDEVEEVKDETG